MFHRDPARFNRTSTRVFARRLGIAAADGKPGRAEGRAVHLVVVIVDVRDRVVNVVRHRARGLRQPSVGDDTGTHSDRVDDLAVSLTISAVERTQHAHRARHRVVRAFVPTDACVQRATDQHLGGVDVQPREQPLMRCALAAAAPTSRSIFA